MVPNPVSSISLPQFWILKHFANGITNVIPQYFPLGSILFNIYPFPISNILSFTSSNINQNPIYLIVSSSSEYLTVPISNALSPYISPTRSLSTLSPYNRPLHSPSLNSLYLPSSLTIYLSTLSLSTLSLSKLSLPKIR